jgi:iron complex outermembrane recepter protein
MNDIIYAVPGLSNQQTAGLHIGTTFSIRGQGETYGQSSPGVVAYFAEVPQILRYSEFTEFYDMNNVQVLKGPQGTLFGRNTTGGAVLFEPNKPTNELSGYFDARLGDYDRQEFEGAIGGAIIPDKVMFRLAGESLQRQGYTLNLYNGEHLDDENRWSIRASLIVKPTEKLENYTEFGYTSVNEDGAGMEIYRISPNCNNGGVQNASCSNGVLEGLPAQYAFLGSTTNPANWAAMQQALLAQQTHGARVTDLNFPTAGDERTWNVINTTTWNATDFLTVKNIFSYRWLEYNNSYDFDGSALSMFNVVNPFAPTEGYTEEVQGQFKFGHFNGVLGFFTDGTTAPVAMAIDPADEYLPVVARAFYGSSNPLLGFYEAGGGSSGSRAVYGQVNAEVLPGLTLTAGYRYTWDHVQTIEGAFGPGGPGAALASVGNPLLGGTSEAGDFQAPTWTFAADYKVNSHVNVYGTIRRGYKDGGFNGTALVSQGESPLFQPEYVTDYEVGVKTNFNLHGVRAVFDLDGFYDDYSNIQRYSNEPTSPPTTITTNAAAAAVTGADVDLNVIPSKYFDISFLYTYTNAWYTKWSNFPVGNPASGYGQLRYQKFPNTPANQFTITPRVHYPLPGDLGRLTLSASIYHQSTVSDDPYNVPNGNALVALSLPGENLPGYYKVDLRLEWANMFGKPITGAVFVQNLTNTTYIVGTGNQLSSLVGIDVATYGAPRMIGIEFNYKFGAR